MKNPDHLLMPVWAKFPELFLPGDRPLPPVDIRRLLSELFVIGDYYHFLIDFRDHSIIHHNRKICSMHGLEQPPGSLQQIIDLTHPDDIEFVARAEEHCYAKVAEIGAQHIQYLKSSYCFRMRVADGSYRLFHHQAIVLDVDPEYHVMRSVNIHTDIQHLTAENTYKAAVMGINGRNDFYQIDSFPRQESEEPKKTKHTLTKREMEILPLIAKGFSSTTIAAHLSISPLTVRVHRKNILRKMTAKNSNELIAKSIQDGLL